MRPLHEPLAAAAASTAQPRRRKGSDAAPTATPQARHAPSAVSPSFLNGIPSAAAKLPGPARGRGGACTPPADACDICHARNADACACMSLPPPLPNPPRMASSAAGDGPPLVTPPTQARAQHQTQTPAKSPTLLPPSRLLSNLQLSSPPPSLPSLECLPNELLQPIAAALVPDSPLTTRFALRPTGTWEFRDARHQWADWLTAHGHLLAFAQTSHRMAAIASPLLYHTIVIPNARSLVLLHQRLARRPEIKSWIREISCLANVAGEKTIEGVCQEWQRETGQRSYFSESSSIPSVRLRPFTAMHLLRDILVGTPNLRNLLIAFPDHDLPKFGSEYADDEDVLCPTLRGAMSSYIPYPQTFPVPYAPLSSFLFFPDMRSLTSLRIYCHREEHPRGREMSWSRVLADYAVWCLPKLTSLKTLELCCSYNNNLFEEDISLPPLPQIEHLRFYGARMQEPRLVAFCLACVRLETLLVHFETSSDDQDRDLLPEGKTLNDALVGLAGTLRTLELVAMAEGHYLTRGRQRPRKPENHRLTCIPELTRLESLTLDYRGLFGTLGILDMDDGERLTQLLPASLRHFTLVCEWGTPKDWKQSYLANLDIVLDGVQYLSDAEPLNLTSISLAIHSWPAESRFRKRFKRDLEQTRKICEEARVLFRTFDLLPSYQDEDEPELPDEFESDEEEEGEDYQEEDPGDEASRRLAQMLAEEEEEVELEEEDEASEYYFSGDSETDEERETRRPPTFAAFLELLGEDHGHTFDELFYAYHEDRWDQYLF